MPAPWWCCCDKPCSVPCASSPACAGCADVSPDNYAVTFQDVNTIPSAWVNCGPSDFGTQYSYRLVGTMPTEHVLTRRTTNPAYPYHCVWAKFVCSPDFYVEFFTGLNGSGTRYLLCNNVEIALQFHPRNAAGDFTNYRWRLLFILQDAASPSLKPNAGLPAPAYPADRYLYDFTPQPDEPVVFSWDFGLYGELPHVNFDCCRGQTVANDVTTGRFEIAACGASTSYVGYNGSALIEPCGDPVNDTYCDASANPVTPPSPGTGSGNDPQPPATGGTGGTGTGTSTGTGTGTGSGTGTGTGTVGGGTGSTVAPGTGTATGSGGTGTGTGYGTGTATGTGTGGGTGTGTGTTGGGGGGGTGGGSGGTGTGSSPCLPCGTHSILSGANGTIAWNNIVFSRGGTSTSPLSSAGGISLRSISTSNIASYSNDAGTLTASFNCTTNVWSYGFALPLGGSGYYDVYVSGVPGSSLSATIDLASAYAEGRLTADYSGSDGSFYSTDIGGDFSGTIAVSVGNNCEL